MRRQSHSLSIARRVVDFWAAADRVCGKRIKPLSPRLVDAMEVTLAGEALRRQLYQFALGYSGWRYVEVEVKPVLPNGLRARLRSVLRRRKAR